ncbi:MAG: hypothetical protein WCB50_04620, partial [Pseudolabrys sp.]
MPFFGKDAREIVHCGGAEAFALTEKHDAIAGITNARRVLQHRLEDRFKLAGRAADNLEHVSGRGLLLERFGQVARASLYFVEQAHILDRYHCLIGEGGDQFNLLIGEW